MKTSVLIVFTALSLSFEREAQTSTPPPATPIPDPLHIAPITVVPSVAGMQLSLRKLIVPQLQGTFSQNVKLYMALYGAMTTDDSGIGGLTVAQKWAAFSTTPGPGGGPSLQAELVGIMQNLSIGINAIKPGAVPTAPTPP